MLGDSMSAGKKEAYGLKQYMDKNELTLEDYLERTGIPSQGGQISIPDFEQLLQRSGVVVSNYTEIHHNLLPLILDQAGSGMIDVYLLKQLLFDLSAQSIMKRVAWAKDPIFRRLQQYLANNGNNDSKIEDIFKDYGNHHPGIVNCNDVVQMLSAGRVTAWITEDAARKLVNDLDTRRNGTLNFWDIVSLYKLITSSPAQESVAAEAGGPIDGKVLFDKMFESLRIYVNYTGVDLVRLFRNIDLDGNNILDKDEWRKALVEYLNMNMTTAESNSIFYWIDVNHDEKIDYLEFVRKFESYSMQFTVNQDHWAFYIFEKIREFIRKSGASLHKIFNITEGNKLPGDRIFTSRQTLLQALIMMQISVSDQDTRRLIDILDKDKNDRLDFMLFLELVGYIQRPTERTKSEANILAGGGSTLAGGAGTMGMGTNTKKNVIREFYIYITQFVRDRKINLREQLSRYDLYNTGLISISEFRNLIEKMTTKYSKSKIHMVAEEFDKELNGRIVYEEFLEKMRVMYQTNSSIVAIIKQLRSLLEYKNKEDIRILFQIYDERGGRFRKDELNNILEQNYINVPDWDLEILMNEFSREEDPEGYFDLYLFEERYNEVVQGKSGELALTTGLDETAKGRTLGGGPRERHILQKVMVSLNNYCNTHHLDLAQAFTKYKITNGIMTQYEFHKSLEELCPDLSDHEINKMVTELDIFNNGEVSFFELSKKYTEYYKLDQNPYEVKLLEETSRKIYQYLAGYVTKKKISIEDMIKEYDRFNQRTISKGEFVDILAGLGVLEEEGTTINKESLEKFAHQYEEGQKNTVFYERFLQKLEVVIEDTKGIHILLSEIKNHVFIHRHDLIDIFRQQDKFNQRFLHRESFISALDQMKLIPEEKKSQYSSEEQNMGLEKGYATYDMVMLDRALQTLEINPEGKFKYHEFIEAINHADMSLGRKFTEKKPENLADTAEMLGAIYRMSLKKKVPLAKLLRNHDFDEDQTIHSDDFIKIVGSLSLPYSEYENENLAEKLSEGNRKKNYIDIADFLTQLNLRFGDERTKIPLDEAAPQDSLDWAEGILSEVAIKLYISNRTLHNYLLHYGVSAKDEVQTHHLVQALRDFGLKSPRREEIQQLVRHLDKNNHGYIKYQELEILIKEREGNAIQRFESELFGKIFTYVNFRSPVRLREIFKYYDNKLDNCLSVEHFQSGLLAIELPLEHDEWEFLVRKYDYYGKNIINYPRFYEDVEKVGSKSQQMTEYVKTALTKLREIVQRVNPNLQGSFSQFGDKETQTVETSQAREILLGISPDIRYTEVDPVLSYLDPEYVGTINYTKLINLIFEDQSALTPAQRDERARRMNEQIKAYTVRKNIDLEKEFMMGDKEGRHFLSYQEIGQVFTSAKMPLSDRQLDLLLNKQVLFRDMEGRIDYIELLTKIYGFCKVRVRESTEPKLHTEASDPAQPHSLRKGHMQGAAPSTELDEFGRQRNIAVEQMTNYFIEQQEIRTYFSPFSDDLITKIRKYLVSSKIDFISHCQQFETFKESGMISKHHLRHVFDKLNIFMKPGEESSFMNRFAETHQGTYPFFQIYDTIMMHRQEFPGSHREEYDERRRKYPEGQRVKESGGRNVDTRAEYLMEHSKPIDNEYPDRSYNRESTKQYQSPEGKHTSFDGYEYKKEYKTSTPQFASNKSGEKRKIKESTSLLPLPPSLALYQKEEEKIEKVRQSKGANYVAKTEPNRYRPVHKIQKDNLIDLPIIRYLKEDDIVLAQEWLKSLSREIDLLGLDQQYLLSRYDPQNSGLISMLDFERICKEEIKMSKFDKNSEVLFQYLTEGRGGLEAIRIIKAMRGEKMTQYNNEILEQYEKQIRSQIARDNIHVRNLIKHLYEIRNHIEFDKIFHDSNGFMASQQFVNSLAEVGYNFKTKEGERLVVSSLDTRKDGRVSLDELRVLINKYEPRYFNANAIVTVAQAKQKILELEPKGQSLLSQINSIMKQSSISREKLYLFLDVNKDGKISRAEFVSGLQAAGITIDKENLHFLFDQLDLNHDNELSWNEFALFIKGAGVRQVGLNRGCEISLNDQIKLEVRELFNRFDQDGNGNITTKDLFEAMKASNPEAKLSEAERLMQRHRTGTIGEMEFFDIMERKIKEDILAHRDDMEALRIKFKENDIDGNGVLTVDEIQYIYIYIQIQIVICLKNWVHDWMKKNQLNS